MATLTTRRLPIAAEELRSVNGAATLRAHVVAATVAFVMAAVLAPAGAMELLVTLSRREEGVVPAPRTLQANIAVEATPFVNGGVILMVVAVAATVAFVMAAVLAPVGAMESLVTLSRREEGVVLELPMLQANTAVEATPSANGGVILMVVAVARVLAGPSSIHFAEKDVAVELFTSHQPLVAVTGWSTSPVLARPAAEGPPSSRLQMRRNAAVKRVTTRRPNHAALVLYVPP